MMRCGLFSTSDRGLAELIASGRSLAATPLSPRMVRSGGMRTHGWLEDDLVRAKPKDFAEPTHLGYLGLPAAAFPEVDRLWLNANGECQLELRPPSLLAQLTDCLHRSALLHLRQDYNIRTIAALLYMVLEFRHLLPLHP